MLGEGYRVTAVQDGFNLLRLLQGGERIDLLILDPDTPGYKRAKITELLSQSASRPLVVLHALSESVEHGPGFAEAKVEKTGELDTLKRAVRTALARRDATDR